jgi:hypothetical protein
MNWFTVRAENLEGWQLPGRVNRGVSAILIDGYELHLAGQLTYRNVRDWYGGSVRESVVTAAYGPPSASKPSDTRNRNPAWTSSLQAK